MNNDHSDSQKIKNTSIFSAMTGLSRLLGLARDILKAYAFGTGIFAVAFDIAFRLPNMLRNLVAEGALSHSFIPVYDKYKKSGEDESKKASGVVISLLFFFLILLSVVVMLTMPYWMPALISEPSERLSNLTIHLGRLLFPYLVFISLASIYMGIQYSHNAFTGPGFGPALMNLIILIFFSIILFFYYESDQLVFIFSWIVLFSGLSNLILQIFLVKRMNQSPSFQLFFQFKALWKHSVRKEITVMMIPAVFAAAVQEISQLIDIFLAMKVHSEVPGGVSALAYSHRLIQLPIGIFGVAVATSSLTQLSSLFNDGKKAEFSNALSTSVNMNLYLLLPASIGLIILSKEIVEVVFMRGSFNAESVAITAEAVRYYAIGITAYSIQKLFMSSFYAVRRPVVAARVTFMVLVVNIVLSIIFLPYLYHAGLALGSSLAGFTGVCIYWIILAKSKVFHFTKPVVFEWMKILFANILLAAFIYYLHYYIEEYSAAIQLFMIIPSSLLVYFILSQVIHLEEFSRFISMVKKRISR